MPAGCPRLSKQSYRRSFTDEQSSPIPLVTTSPIPSILELVSSATVTPLQYWTVLGSYRLSPAKRQRFQGQSVPRREKQRLQGHSVTSREMQRLQGPFTHSCQGTSKVRPRQTSCDGCNYRQTLSQKQIKHSVWMPLCGGRFRQGNQCHAKYSLNFTGLNILLLLLFIPKIYKMVCIL